MRKQRQICDATDEQIVEIAIGVARAVPVQLWRRLFVNAFPVRWPPELGSPLADVLVGALTEYLERHREEHPPLD